MLFRLLCLAIVILGFNSCQSDKKTPVSPTAAAPVNASPTVAANPLSAGMEQIPPSAKIVNANVNSVHVWIDKGNVCLAGIVSNMSAEWHKYWLEASPVDQSGRPIAFNGHSGVVVSPHCDAVPPSSRTSFFASWPLNSFSGTPHNFNFKAWAEVQKPGPVLSIPATSAIQMSVPQPTGQNLKPEVAWQMTGALMNPLNMVAAHPRIEVLVFGNDQKLWFATVFNPEDQAMRKIFSWDREGPLKPKEERQFNLQVYTLGMADSLKDLGIKKIDLIPFNARLAK